MAAAIRHVARRGLDAVVASTGAVASRTINVALAAEEGAGLGMFRWVLERGHRIALVLTSTPGERGGALWNAAQTAGVPVRPSREVKDPALAHELRERGVDLLLNVHSLHVIHDAVLTAPRIGSFNLHPGPLPRYAGLNSPTWAIWRGEREHGVTIHHMIAGIDTGPIAYQARFPIEPRDTAFTLGVRCADEGLRLMSTLIDTAASDPAAIPRVEQDLSAREYFGRDLPEDRWVPWERSVDDVLRLLRALDYHPLSTRVGHARARKGSLELAIVRASEIEARPPHAPGLVDHGPARDVRVACADGWVRLDVTRVEGKRVHPAELLRPGDRLDRAA